MISPPVKSVTDWNAVQAGLTSRLAAHGQSGVLAFWNELDDASRRRLANQLAALDLELIERLYRGGLDYVDWPALASRAVSPPAIRLHDEQASTRAAVAREVGASALRAGRVGMLLVAGGQGSRLGFEHPKGMFPLGPVSKHTLFQIIFDHLRAVERRYERDIPLYIMTSPATHAETVGFLAQQRQFGLAEQNVKIFCQSTMPAVDLLTGQLLLESRSSLCLSPDGHGGMLAAFARSGCLADVQARGLTQLFYGQIDNPLLQVCSAELIGHHLQAGSEMTTQVVAKTRPEEKVGVVVSIDGRMQMIEYSDLPPEYAAKRTPDGRLLHWAGNMAVHVFATEFLARSAVSTEALPFHRAKKTVPHISPTGQPVSPTAPNAVKFERFIFDLLPLARQSLVVEADPAEAFAPVKNADAAGVDSPATSRAAMLRLHRAWLLAAGADVPANVPVEISPLFALDAAEVARRVPPGQRFTSPTFLE